VPFDVVVLGGFGHVGLPLAMSLAHKGKRVCAFDINPKAGDLIAQGKMPFHERGAEKLLGEVLRSGCLSLSLDPKVVSEADSVIIIIGTPVGRHLNPEFEQLRNMIDAYMPFFRDGQLIVLRSTVYPGTTEKLQAWFQDQGKKVDLAFCPERIAEGVTLIELETLPQIVSGFSEDGVRRSRELFSLLTSDIVQLTPLQAELAKLFTNVWRYIRFATANQFFMIADGHGEDFYAIHHAMTYKYDRAKDLPTPGFTAGPCLFKDTMQLAAYNNNSFFLGHAAMLVNEGLPNYVVTKLKQRCNLAESTVGILGMAYKGNIDDRRESLSYKLKAILTFESRRVLCSDVYISEPGFVSQEDLFRQSDILILAAPHREYRTLQVPDDKVVIDIWNFWGKGSLI